MQSEPSIVKYPRTPYWPGSPNASVARSQRIHAAPDVFVGRDIAISEKLDGANTLLYRGNVYSRSATPGTSHPWQAMVKQQHAWKLASEPDVMLWGEDIYAVHSIQYGPVPPDRTFYAFAAMNNFQFVAYDQLVSVTTRLGIPTVPVLFTGVFSTIRLLSDFVNRCHQQPSVLGGEREGVVIRLASAFSPRDFGMSVCKSVRPNHVQTDTHWTRTWSPCQITGRI